MKHLIKQLVDVLIECEMPTDRKAGFRREYEEVSGHAPNEDFIKTQNNKFGIEYRVYFNAPAAVVDELRLLGFNVEGPRTSGYRSDLAYRINVERFFWELIQRGFHLGEN